MPVGIRPAAAAVGEGSVFVANTEDESISRIDARSRELIRTIPVGEYPSDVAVGEGSAWVALGGPAQIRTIALERNEVEEPFFALEFVQSPFLGEPPVPPVQNSSRTNASLATGGKQLWFACNSGGSFPQADISRIDPSSERADRADEALVSSSPVALRFADVAFGFESAWIANRAANTVSQIEAGTLRKVREVAVGRAPEAVAVGLDSVWVANTDDDTVSRLTIGGPDEPVETETIPVGDGPVDVGVGEDAVWVVNRGDRTISRIDPQTNEVVATIELEHEPVRIAAGEGAVWVTVQEAAEE